MVFAFLHQAFEAQADLRPEVVAVVFGDIKLTYAQIERRSNKMAHMLRSRGVQTGSLVAILLPRSPDAYCSILAVLKAGAAYIPLDQNYPPSRIKCILEDSNSNVLITTSTLAPNAGDFGGSVINLDNVIDEIEENSPDRIPSDTKDLSPNDLCYVIYTSGSTGRPKGVQVEHRNATNLIDAEHQVFQVTPEDRVCQLASLSFDLSVEEIWLAFASGATLVAMPPEASHGGSDFSRKLNEERVTVLSTVPTLLSTFDDDIPTIRLLILGGETCPEWVVSRWAQPGRRLVNTYGPTETTVTATYADLVSGKPITIGTPIPGYSVFILDESLNQLPQGSIGEICIGGAGVARGYIGLPDQNAKNFISDPFHSDKNLRVYRTGDLGRINSEGNIEFLGRTDGQVKLRGFRIELSEIESAMLKIEGVQAAACVVREDTPGSQLLVGYVVSSPGSMIDASAIRSKLRNTLPIYMVPSIIESIDSLPITSNGKLDRSALPPPRPHSTEDWTVNLGTETEQLLHNIWSSLFNSQSILPEDNFFLDLGGHSLLAARLISKLRNEPRFARISLADVYENPTIRSLAAKMDELQSVSSNSALPADVLDAQANNQSNLPRDNTLGAVLQSFGLYLSFAFRAFEWITPYLVFFMLLLTGHQILYCVTWAIVSAVLVFPILLVLALAAKWLILGKIRPGHYPLWKSYYVRWWIAQSLIDALPLNYLTGTPLLPAVYRLLGARIGKNVHLETDRIRAFDLISIGDNTSIGEDAGLLGYCVQQGELVMGHITIGRDCYVGTRAMLREETAMEDAGRLEDLSLLPRGTKVPKGETWSGSPARASSPPDKNGVPPPARGRLGQSLVPVVYGLLVVLLPLIVLVGILPGVLLLFSINPTTQTLLYIVAVPGVGALFVVLVMSEFVLLKWVVMGRAKPGMYPVHSGFYIRDWFVGQMHSIALDYVGPLHATIYTAPWYRALGAKLGKSVELSTASSITPDLLDLGDESTVADDVTLGSPLTERGWMNLASTKLGKRTFVGNSAVIPAGTTTGEGTLCGVLTSPPSDKSKCAKAGASWLGSPPIELPHRQQSPNFRPETTFHPTRKMFIKRGAFEILRVTLPPAGFILVVTSVLEITVYLWHVLGLLPALLIFPIAYAAACFAIALGTAVAKWVIIGRYRPFEKPLWNNFVQRLELVNALFEFLTSPLMLEPLRGTPFLPGYQRLMGSKIGKGVYMNTTGFLEWDLTEVGNGVALNEDCVLQTHLFEDRILKASHLCVGDNCDVGAYSIVLYESEMGENSRLDALSLLMKGERLPKGTAWYGNPARRNDYEIESVD